MSKIILMKKIITSFFLVLLLSFYSNTVLAQEDFNTFCRLTYRFFENGNAAVTQEISLINQRPDIYVTEYSLKLSGGEIKNIKAWDNLGPLPLTTTVFDKTMTIALKFNEKVVGKGQTLSFILKYEIPNLAKKEGNIWRIILPKLNWESQPVDYSMEVKVPFSFGSIAFASPSPRETVKEAGFINYLFEKKDILNTGILLEFGHYQVFDFTLIYQLENTDENKVLKKITLPPDTPYQVVNYSKIEPPPHNVIADEDGNWLAEFILEPKSRTEIKATGKVKIFPSPTNKDIIPVTNLQSYLEEKSFWESQDPRIKEISKNLKTPSQIYNFVVNKLNYNYERVGKNKMRLGGIGALDSPNDALCLEFTDLFITLARSAGIPAREVEGFAYTDNPKLRPLSLVSDILHAWPEYYDFETSSWRMVDPTWEKTTGGFDYFTNFDMSHFTFVIHGINSEYPLPPGSYKFPGEESKNIFVTYGQDFLPQKKNLNINLNITKPNLLKRRVDGFLEIANLGSAALYNLPIIVTGEKKFRINITEENLSYILPYGKKSLPLTIEYSTPLFKNVSYTIGVKVGDFQKIQNISIKFLGQEIIATLLVVLIIFFILFLVRLKRKC